MDVTDQKVHKQIQLGVITTVHFLFVFVKSHRSTVIESCCEYVIHVSTSSTIAAIGPLKSIFPFNIFLGRQTQPRITLHRGRNHRQATPQYVLHSLL